MIRIVKKIIKVIFRLERWRCRLVFLRDGKVFWDGMHGASMDEWSHCEAQLAMLYHVVEKGLTMPCRKLGFGKAVVMQLMTAIKVAEGRYGQHEATINHAIGVVKAYWELHKAEGCDFSEDKAFWRLVSNFISQHPNILPSLQPQINRAEFYKNSESPFPSFAKSRHTVRHYTDAVVPLAVIKDAVELAMTTPSACNRQHVRVHCVVTREKAHKILEIQGGNRGFGHLADKVLIITSNLSVEMTFVDRFDPYVNGGMFLMNLCYALHYFHVAHCILTCSIADEKIHMIKELAQIPQNEVVVAMLSCGVAPNEFEIASSPRKHADEILSLVR